MPHAGAERCEPTHWGALARPPLACQTAPVRARLLPLLLATPALLLAAPAPAHPLAPSLLELRAAGGGTFDVLWKTPAVRVRGSDLAPRLPGHCTPARDAAGVAAVPTWEPLGDGLAQRWRVDCGAEGLAGSRVAVDGLAASRTDALLRIEFADGRRVRGLLRPDAPSLVVPRRESALAVARAYATLGVSHILGGFDHLLFVLGLVLLVRVPRTTAWAITGFTAGHSLTLALAVLGLLRVPTGPVELGIAGSILWLGVELSRPGHELAARGRRAAALALPFGLLHGLGFAGALREAGLPSGDIPLALFAFNLGIEAGQLAFVVLVLSGLALARRAVPNPPAWAPLVPAYAVGTLAAYWCFQRAAGLW